MASLRRQDLSLSCGLNRQASTGRWGWFVLGVELLGATTTMLYGINIIMDPVHEPLREDPEHPGLTKVQAHLSLSKAPHCAW